MAISFDAKGTGNNGGGTTITWSHTVGAGGNRIIFAETLANVATGSITSIKFAGQAMTKIISADSLAGAVECELWYLVNPPVGLGTFNGTWSANAGAENDGISLSYFGVNQLAPVLGSASKLGTATNAGINTGLTFVGANSWLVGVVGFDNTGGTITTGVFRGTASNGGGNLIGADNIAGTLVWSNANGASNWAIVAAEFSPYVPPGYKTLLGVGQQ